MKLVIHDLGKNTFDALFPKIDNQIQEISSDRNIHSCIGCFGCWIKTPGECIIKDDYNQIGAMVGKCDELIFISKCTYGGFSPFIKNVLDRGISYAHPYFVVRNGELHHKRRYKNVIKISAYFYGENISNREKETANKLVIANAINIDGLINKIVFIDNIDKMREIAL